MLNRPIRIRGEPMHLDLEKSDNEISPMQKAILDFIRDYPRQYSPAVREIGAGVGLRSSSSVQHHLDKLDEQGHIERRPKCARCIVVKTP